MIAADRILEAASACKMSHNSESQAYGQIWMVEYTAEYNAKINASMHSVSYIVICVWFFVCVSKSQKRMANIDKFTLSRK